MYVDIADKVTEDLIKQDTGNLIDRVGLTNNTGATVSSGTLMGKANKIISDLGTANSSINTLTTNIGSTSASGGTTTSGSVMAKLNKIVGNTNTLVNGVSIVKRVLFGTHICNTASQMTIDLGVTINPSKTIILIQNDISEVHTEEGSGTTGATYVTHLSHVTEINSTNFKFTSNYGKNWHANVYGTISWQLIEFY